MNKILRYSFIALLALVCNVTFGQEVTLDFTDNTNWKFPEGSGKAQKDAADFTDGAMSILTGIGANISMRTGEPVKVQELIHF